MTYVPLHLHTQYSVLDGLSTPAEYMHRAKELDMSHISMTDHGTLMGHRDFQKAAAAENITPILGLEAYISPTDRFDKRSKANRKDGTSAYNHITLLSLNQRGFENLSRLSEIAWTEGFYQKPRIDLEALEQYSGDIVALSGCLNGLICKSIELGEPKAAEAYARRLLDIFGDRFYIEVQSHNPKDMNHALLEIADRLSIPPVMASDCHYANPDDLWLEEAMLILSTNPDRAKKPDQSKMAEMELLERYNYLYPDRKMTFQEIQLYLRSHEDERLAFAKQGIERDDIFRNTNQIAERVGEYEYYEALDLLPKPNVEPNGRLEKLVFSGLNRKGLADDEKYVERANHELEIIKDKDFASYFLVVANMIAWAKQNDILVGPGRGSAAGSLVCYATGITDVDPIKYNLLFARFLDPERSDIPDIDVDFEDARRHEVKEYLKRKFKNVASISTMSYFKDKGVVRDAARVLGVPIGEVNSALKKVDFYEDYLRSQELAEFRKKYPDVQRIADGLRGRIRNVGMHAAGVVVANDKINKYAPIETRNSEDGRIPVIGYDMGGAEEVGLVKIDVLGLKTLTVIKDTLESVKIRFDESIKVEDIPLDDHHVFRMLSKGRTAGVFQAEAAPFTRLLTEMGVDHFSHIVAANALVRPGAMNTVGKDFIARKQGRQPILPVHPIYDSITRDAYGFPIYQEHVMRLCVELAGMSWGDAAKVRRIIGKKKDPKEFEVYREKFVTGAQNNVKKAVAEKLWHDFEAHAGYSFNKSHAVAYSMLTYYTAWLKVHYPVDFFYAVLKNEKDPDVRSRYLAEAKKADVTVLLPNVNDSQSNYSIKDNKVVMGLTDVKYISDKTAANIIAKRPYKSFKHLKSVAFTKYSGISSRAVDALDKIGAATFYDNPLRGDEKEYYYEFLGIPVYTANLPKYIMRQIDPVDEFDEKGVFKFVAMVKNIKRGQGWSRVEIADESSQAHIFADEKTQMEAGQMYLMLVANNSVIRYVAIDEVDSMKDTDPFIRYLYATKMPFGDDNMGVLAFNTRTTKARKKMATAVFSKADKELRSALVFPSTYARALAKMRPGSIVDVKLDKTQEGTSFVKAV